MIKQCPVCGETKSIDGDSKRGNLVNFATHIKATARRELFDREFFNETKLPHVEWLKKNSHRVSKLSFK